MGKLVMFGISYDSDKEVYFAGQIVQGYVTIELRAPMKMRGIHLSLEGKAVVSWSETRTVGSGKDSTTETVSYTSHETYVDLPLLLTGRWKKQSGDNMHLSAGRHVFPFAFQLPPELPSSFEGAHGYIRYTLTATVDKPWKFDHVTNRPFTVNAVLDLNTEPNVAQTMTQTGSKQFCCLWCASGPINATLVLDRRGFVPGETIFIKADIENNSTRNIKRTEARLNMETHFYAGGSTNLSRKCIGKVKHGGIMKGDSDMWEGSPLLLPELPPSGLRGCKIMDVKYILELRVVPSGPGYDLVVPVEVIIGTIPFQHGIPRPINAIQAPVDEPPPPYSPPMNNQGQSYPPPMTNQGHSYPPPMTNQGHSYPPPMTNPETHYPPPMVKQGTHYSPPTFNKEKL